MQRWTARRQAKLCCEKRLKAVGHLARKGETARGHRDGCEEEGRRGNGFSARARTEPGLMGDCCQKETPHRAVTQVRGCLLRLEDHSESARDFVTSQHEDCFSVITSLHLIPLHRLDFVFCNIQLSTEHLHLIAVGSPQILPM